MDGVDGMGGQIWIKEQKNPRSIIFETAPMHL